MSLDKQVPIETQSSILKLRDSLDLISKKVDTNDINLIISQTMSVIKTYFDEIGNAEFNPIEFRKGDTPKSDIYNSNITQIYNDLNRFYIELNNINTVAINSYNYSQVVIEEIKKRAQSVASIVLDLNILSNFNRQDAIVAGDDFTTTEFIDKNAGIASRAAEPLVGGYGISLARDSSTSIIANSKIDIFPVSPSSSNGVNVKPTPNNFNRFYEGSYYEFLGASRPEGGRFNIRYGSLEQGNNVQSIVTSQQEATDLSIYVTGQGFIDRSVKSNSFYYDAGASQSDKEAIRRKMTDKDPTSFWECEYVIPLASPLGTDEQLNEANIDSSTIEVTNDNSSSELQNTNYNFSSEELNERAQSEDSLDLIVDIVVTLPQETWINFVAINPVIFSKISFLEIMDIATASESEDVFYTVDGWNSLKYPKSITPEANEYLTDSQNSAVLSPSRSNYLGQGIYPFPLRFSKKIKIRVKSANPISQVYERVYVLLKNMVDIDLTVTKKTSRGLF